MNQIPIITLAILFMAACGPTAASDAGCDPCSGASASAIDCDKIPTPSGCSHGDPPEDPPPPPPTSIAPLVFNNGFDDRTFGYTGSCACVDHDSNPSTVQILTCAPVQTANTCYCRATGTGGTPNSSWVYDVACAAPIDAPNGWAVSPPELFRGTGGAFFLYGMGRNPGTPRPPGYQVPDGTALYFQTCDNSDRWNNVSGPNSLPDGLPDSDWCYRTPSIIVRSPSFAPTSGVTYRLSAWFYSTTFMSVGSVHENKLQVRARFFNGSGVEIGGGVATAPNAAPTPVDGMNRSIWQEFSALITAPTGTTTGFVELVQGLNHQSNVYVDDVTLTAP